VGLLEENALMNKAIKADISALKNLQNIVAVAINIYKILKLKKLGFLAQPNLLLTTTNHC